MFLEKTPLPLPNFEGLDKYIDKIKSNKLVSLFNCHINLQGLSNSKSMIVEKQY